MSRLIRLGLALSLFAFLASASRQGFAQTPAPAPEKAAPAAAKPAEAARPNEAPTKPGTPPPAVETPAVVINGDAATTLLGKMVKSVHGGDLGRVVDLIADRNGTLRAAVIDFGGFLGVGTRKIAVDWSALHFPKQGSLNTLIVDLPRNQLKNAPAFKEGEPIVVIGGPPAAKPPAAAPAPAAAPPPPPGPKNGGAAEPKP